MISNWAIDPAWAPRIAEAYALQAGGIPTPKPKQIANIVGDTMVIDVMGLLMPSPGTGLLALLGAGGSTYSAIGSAVTMADNSDAIKSVRFHVDSPGGAVTGVRELAALIAACSKPTLAVVSGNCCSAAIWLAAAADRIVAAHTAVIGCVGVMRIVEGDMTKTPHGSPLRRFVSSQTPDKSAGPDDEGASQYQAVVDDFAGQFLDDLARFRGVDRSKVAEQYGKGAILPARDALKRGIIDGLTGPDSTASTDPAASRTEGAIMPMPNPAELSREELEEFYNKNYERVEEPEDEALHGDDEEEDEMAADLPATGDKEAEDRIKDNLPADQAVARDTELRKLKRQLQSAQSQLQTQALHTQAAQAGERKLRIDALIESGRIGTDDAARATAEYLYDAEQTATVAYARENDCDLAAAAGAQGAFTLFSDMEGRAAGYANRGMRSTSIGGQTSTGQLDSTLATAKGFSTWCDKYCADNGVNFSVASDAFQNQHPDEFRAVRLNGRG
ncbi:MAG: hypothetical protein COA38_20560 [Fluviicola sp.]|nr:MAG: hypothetical protein COA38_20560 [Fluviicola sp.]